MSILIILIQVLSSSVSPAMSFNGDQDTQETQIFVHIFFDCLNVPCMSEPMQKRKPDLRPYRDPSNS